MFIINNLEVLFEHFIIIQITYYYIIITARTALNSFTVKEAENHAVSTKKYFIIKKTLFTFRKEFATTSNRRRYY